VGAYSVHQTEATTTFDSLQDLLVRYVENCVFKACRSLVHDGMLRINLVSSCFDFVNRVAFGLRVLFPDYEVKGYGLCCGRSYVSTGIVSKPSSLNCIL